MEKTIPRNCISEGGKATSLRNTIEGQIAFHRRQLSYLEGLLKQKQAQQAKRENLACVLSKVASAFNLTPLQVTSKNREMRHCAAKRCFAFLAKEIGYCVAEITAFLGCDHTTVLYYLRDYELWMWQRPELNALAQAAADRCGVQA